MSRQAELIVGYPLSRWLTESEFWISILHPEDREWIVAFRDFLLTERPKQVSIDYRMVTADGRTIWVREKVTVVVEGEFVKLRGITMDITEAKEAEEKFFKAFHNSPTAMAIARKSDQRFIEVNDQFIALTGYSRDELIGQTAQDLLLWLHPPDQMGMEEQLRRHGEVRANLQTVHSPPFRKGLPWGRNWSCNCKARFGADGWQDWGYFRTKWRQQVLD